MSIALYYNQFGSPEETLGLAEVIDRLRGLSPRMLTATLGTCLGMMQEIAVQENRWAGEEARESWKVKYEATIEAYIKLVAKHLPVNHTLVNHAAKEIFVHRNALSPSNFLSFMWFNAPATIINHTRRSCLNSNILEGVAREEEDRAFDDWMNSHSMNMSVIYGALENTLQEMAGGYQGTAETDPAVQQAAFIDSHLSTMMENPEISPFINVAGCRTLLMRCINMTKDFLGNYIPTEEVSVVYIVTQMLPEILPVNYKLSDIEAAKVATILRAMPKWKID
jgi:hypothetical protein